jgi:hypothetical protein
MRICNGLCLKADTGGLLRRQLECVKEWVAHFDVDDDNFLR